MAPWHSTRCTRLAGTGYLIKLCDKSYLTVAVWARGAHMAFLLLGHKHLYLVGLLSDGVGLQHLPLGREQNDL